MRTLEELIRVLDLRAKVVICEDGEEVFDGYAYELMDSDEGFLVGEVVDFSIDSSNNELNISTTAEMEPSYELSGAINNVVKTVLMLYNEDEDANVNINKLDVSEIQEKVIDLIWSQIEQCA